MPPADIVEVLGIVRQTLQQAGVDLLSVRVVIDQLYGAQLKRATGAIDVWIQPHEKLPPPDPDQLQIRIEAGAFGWRLEKLPVPPSQFSPGMSEEELRRYASGDPNFRITGFHIRLNERGQADLVQAFKSWNPDHPEEWVLEPPVNEPRLALEVLNDRLLQQMRKIPS